jgi:hypothetical protein
LTMVMVPLPVFPSPSSSALLALLSWLVVVIRTKSYLLKEQTSNLCGAVAWLWLLLGRDHCHGEGG